MSTPPPNTPRPGTSAPRYYAPGGGLPAQTELPTGRAVVTEAYTVIPRGVLRDIVTSVLPEWTDTRTWILNRPVAGGTTTFAQYLVEVGPGGGSRAPEPEMEVESFVFVLEGTLTVRLLGTDHPLPPGGFAYLPPEALWGAFNDTDETATFAWIRKAWQPLAGRTPQPVFGNEAEIEPVGMPGADNKWRTTSLIPVDDVAYDMHMNVVTFEPGAVSPFAGTHVMEHGLYVLEGKAVYRLNQDWVEVEAGDYLSLRAFCPQACYAGGPGNFRYLLYQDVNRQVLLGGRR
ncbi:(S)-ureidoglycine aminohydrolase [Arthrobacter sp. zg-Y40]|uniref:bifunctional allantoicase/(S)-ureidoglycine aminohydrolase n=1 Tax=Arthrobacter sp. zg-Y40 TaxID=2886939 RepID=UPI001D15BDA2|nr:bifunctional allantoicase/(S)-ureidoglycine aminohydrolase [Arthrobacter sp. zg-Y40]MCC3278386.1 (S)-ureidoglycine aminohydrolase [Arthrobacter sp. zg-Y40]